MTVMFTAAPARGAVPPAVHVLLLPSVTGFGEHETAVVVLWVGGTAYVAV